jgi:formylglycine-generating enzyme required for sulfatase activity
MARRIAALATLAALAFAGTVGAAEREDWLKDRQARFAAYQAAHPRPEAEAAQIKSATAAMLADAPFNRDPDRPPVIWRTSNPPTVFWDGAELPEMIAVPAGEFTMGASPSEAKAETSETPRHRVRIDHSFAVSRYPVTVGEFARFVADTHYDMGDACFTLEGGKYKERGSRNWLNTGYPQTDASPVVCVNWNDAQAYVAWLSRKSGHSYRLLSEAEYEYVNRAGTQTVFWWGDAVGRNHADCDGCGSAWDNRSTAPVASFAPNGFGLYDTTGNVFTWLADCWNPTYAGAPTDGSADLAGDCDLHVLRGGSLHNAPAGIRSARRSRHWFSLRNITVGLRVARAL